MPQSSDEKTEDFKKDWRHYVLAAAKVLPCLLNGILTPGCQAFGLIASIVAETTKSSILLSGVQF